MTIVDILTLVWMMAFLCANSKFDARRDDVITQSSSMNEIPIRSCQCHPDCSHSENHDQISRDLIIKSMQTDNMDNSRDFAHDKLFSHDNFNNISTFCLEKSEPTDLVLKSNHDDANCDDARLFDMVNKTQNGEEHASLYGLVLCRLRELASWTSPAVTQSSRSEFDHQEEDQNDRNIGYNHGTANLSEQTSLKIPSGQISRDRIEKSTGDSS